MISIRPICRSDYATWRSMLDDYDDELGVKDIECAWERFFTAPNKFVGKVAEFDGETAGFIHYTFHEFVLMRGRICYLANLYVKPEFRRRGIAREMLEQLIAQAQNESWRRVYWVTEHSNPARALYDQYATPEFTRYHRDFWEEPVNQNEPNEAPKDGAMAAGREGNDV